MALERADFDREARYAAVCTQNLEKVAFGIVSSTIRQARAAMVNLSIWSNVRLNIEDEPKNAIFQGYKIESLHLIDLQGFQIKSHECKAYLCYKI